MAPLVIDNSTKVTKVKVKKNSKQLFKNAIQASDHHAISY